MKITRCKLKKSIQKKLLQFFVLEVTARSAADLLGIHPNSAVCRVETVGQHGLRVGEVLRVPEVDGVEGHGFAFLSVVLKRGGGCPCV